MAVRKTFRQTKSWQHPLTQKSRCTKTITIAGRIMSKRVMGKASFCNIQDLQGNIQSYVARDSIGEESYADFKKYDVGDIIGISGEVFKTKTEEISPTNQPQVLGETDNKKPTEPPKTSDTILGFSILGLFGFGIYKLFIKIKNIVTQ